MVKEQNLPFLFEQSGYMIQVELSMATNNGPAETEIELSTSRRSQNNVDTNAKSFWNSSKCKRRGNFAEERVSAWFQRNDVARRRSASIDEVKMRNQVSSCSRLRSKQRVSEPCEELGRNTEDDSNVEAVSKRGNCNARGLLQKRHSTTMTILGEDKQSRSRFCNAPVHLRNNLVLVKYGAESCPNINSVVKQASKDTKEGTNEETKAKAMASKAMAKRKQAWPQKISGRITKATVFEENEQCTDPFYNGIKSKYSCGTSEELLPKIPLGKRHSTGNISRPNLFASSQTATQSDTKIHFPSVENIELDTSSTESEPTVKEFESNVSLVSYSTSCQTTPRRARTKPRLDTPNKPCRGRDSILFWIGNVNRNHAELFDQNVF